MATTLPAVVPAIPPNDVAQLPSPGPGTVDVTKLEQKHPEYLENQETWNLIQLLYCGGDKIRREAARVLQRRAKEIQELYQERCSILTYQNILGSGIDYYLAAIFGQQPECDAHQEDDPEAKIVELAPDDKKFWDDFRENCDRKNDDLTYFFRDVLRDALLYRTSWILIDLPMPAIQPSTLLEQESQGLLDPYLVQYSVCEVTNWGEDEFEGLEWVLIHTVALNQAFLQTATKTDRWYYFDKQNFSVYERKGVVGKDPPKTANLIAGPAPHALSQEGQIPVYRFRLPEGLWLANRVLPQVMEHLNQDNIYGYALRKSNLAMPVISGPMNETPVLSEAGYLKIPAGCTFGWTEPGGVSFERSAQRVESLREEIYRQMYLQPQGRSSRATPMMASGYSKEMDMVPSAHVQNYLGDELIKAMQWVLNAASDIRQEGLDWDVRGFDFKDDLTDFELARAQQFTALQITSPTAERENQKRVVRTRFKDANPPLLNTMCQEIDDTPTLMEQQQAQQDKQDQMMNAQFQANAGGAAAAENSDATDKPGKFTPI
jgi:hypothetical protein